MSLHDYLNRPLKIGDRILAIVMGAFGGFWLGLFACMAFASTPVPLQEVAYWLGSGALVGVILGAIFPRVIMIIFYPFMFITIGGN